MRGIAVAHNGERETAAEEDDTVYFKILDRIADGYFKDAKTDKELYDKFLRLLKSDGLITDSELLSSFELALSVHNAAPRIEAHYQFYKSSMEPLMKKSGAPECDTWLEFAGKQFCSPQLEKEDAVIQGLAVGKSPLLPFDRQSGSDAALPATIYTDITSPEFAKFHALIKKTAEDGKVSYRVRHKSPKGERSSLEISGFGAELALKRTDYIVIDDRNAEERKEQKKDEKTAEEALDADEEVTDLTPLSSSELEDLSMKTASYVMNSEYPLKRLLKVTQDFPKYSSFLASQDISQPFRKEHVGNRELFLPAGYNVMWMNGVQYDARKMDVYSLLDHMRRERKLIGAFKDLSFTNSEAIQLLTHPAIAEAQQDAETLRYDWRDETEGGNVIIWLNDIEKDKRYEEWPSSLMALLQRTYPGQLPMVRRDLHNVIIPVDFSEPRSVAPVVETVQDFVKRRIPVRFGIVPLSLTTSARQQGRIAYHIHEAYGLGALMSYLETALASKKITAPHEGTFHSVLEKRNLKEGFDAMSIQEVLEDAGDGNDRLQKAYNYLARLWAKNESPPLFVNGVPIKNDDEWLQAFSQRVSMDVRVVQRGVFEGTIDEGTWLPSLFLNSSSLRRNSLIIPEDGKQIKLVSLLKAYSGRNEELVKNLPTIPAAEDAQKGTGSQLVVVADFGTNHGLQLLLNAVEFRQQQSNIELSLVQNGNSHENTLSRFIYSFNQVTEWTEDTIQKLAEEIGELVKLDPDVAFEDKIEEPWQDGSSLVEALGFKPGESGLVLNGRKVGPIPTDEAFTTEDFGTLYGFEFKKRIMPAVAAITDLVFADKVGTTLDHAKLFSILAVSTVSDMPEGIFELPPPIRTRLFYEWNTTNTAITVGDNNTAVIQIVAAIDPATETAQLWVPILKVLSELDGVYLRLFLNPREKLQELPVKRFYRYALDTKPSFDEHGVASSLGVKFEGIPKDALLTAGLNVPPSWLVAPKESVHDLDNIKLSSLAPSTSLQATYELENILIEGHPRDVTTGIAPRGAQLALSTAKDEHFADTIIMANLGYFQFKANPGYYNISLLPGLSQKIFNIDSVGALGYDPQPGDETTEVTLMSFQGVTLYPRLSRKPGMEEEDVLGTPKPGAAGTAAEIVSKGANMVDGLLSKVGVRKPQTGKYVSEALAGVRNLFSKAVANVVPLGDGVAHASQAEINIFSVASGHLYERMLNIMMLSVMKHTNHTVKFWFIEQFLSSSFKAFLPTLAKEYGFQYEMVTYKWPHWLRAQKEKQREIWGYKILFLDVLFPLDLDKVIFVDADQIVRTDMIELVNLDLKGAPYGFTPMCDSRTEMEGFRFWKQGYWKNFLRGLPYHISALYVVDLKRFRQIAAGDRLRQQYHQLSADPGSLSNLDQDLPNNMQMVIPIRTLPQEWLWCETWCSDESLKDAKTIDLCNNPMTKEPKLDRARRQVPEWNEYDEEIAALARRTKGEVPKGDEQERMQKDEEVKKVEEEKEKGQSSPEHNEL
jgi:UDP-glucose:glycoprotein glucosyltransferase